MTTGIVPVRLRLSRAKGFDLQALSLATNGLPAIVVARPSRWGNPFSIYRIHADLFGVIGPDGDQGGAGSKKSALALAVLSYSEWLNKTFLSWPDNHQLVTPLRGQNLACWCLLDQPCHADALLRLANPDHFASAGNPIKAAS